MSRSVKSNLNRSALLCLAAGALILACGPRVAPKDQTAERDANTRTTAPDNAIAASTNVSVGNGVHFTLHVTNLHDRALELRFPNGQTHEFVVVDSSGKEVWRWSQGRLFTQSLQNRLLDSRETLTFAEQWQRPALTGRFTAISRLRSSNHPVEEHVDFVLP